MLSSIKIIETLENAYHKFDAHDFDGAQRICKVILAENANEPDCYNLLGAIAFEQSRYKNAIFFFKKAIAIRNDGSYYFNLANTCKALSKFENAIKNYRAAINQGAEYPSLYYNLAMSLRALDRKKEATEIFTKLVAANPTDVDALVNLGVMLIEQNDGEEAINCFRRAISIRPDENALVNLWATLANNGEVVEANDVYEKLMSLYPRNKYKFNAILQPPIIAPSVESIRIWRDSLKSKLWSGEYEKLSINDPLSELGSTYFYLAFQGFCNRDINIKYAELLRKVCPSLTWMSNHCSQPRKKNKRVRVGFISHFFYSHSIGKTSKGLIEKLDRERFEIHILLIPPVNLQDPITKSILSCANHSHILPDELAESRILISKLKLDILYYQDIGMEPFSYYLSFSRLAPVQCVSFGHPDTTGINTIDYYVSTDMFETEGSEYHYSEKLYKLKKVATPAYYFEPVHGSDRSSRENFGLDEKDNIYCCPQTLFKFHPDFDTVLASVLKMDPKAKIICIEAHNAHWTSLLKERFRSNIGKDSDRIKFLPRQSYADYLDLLSVSDVILDTPHFNGMNTTLESFSIGKPIVAMSGMLQRGHHTVAMYRKMGVFECIAETKDEYANLAVKLATNSIFHNRIVEKIKQNKVVLFEDANVINEWGDFFLHAYANGRPS